MCLWDLLCCTSINRPSGLKVFELICVLNQFQCPKRRVGLQASVVVLWFCLFGTWDVESGMTWLRLAFSLCSLVSSCDLDRGYIQKLRKQHEMNGCGFIVVDFFSKYQFHSISWFWSPTDNALILRFALVRCWTSQRFSSLISICPWCSYTIVTIVLELPGCQDFRGQWLYMYSLRLVNCRWYAERERERVSGSAFARVLFTELLIISLMMLWLICIHSLQLVCILTHPRGSHLSFSSCVNSAPPPL